ncbi:MAG: DcaP family trimeric outer membrane transporter [Sulfurifustaceae bacterium]
MNNNGYIRSAYAGAALMASLVATIPARAADEAKGLQFYGYVQGDYIYDFKRVDPNWNATLRASKIPVTCPGDAGCGTDGESIFSVRQTRIGVRGDVASDAGPVNLLLEVDFFGVGGSAGQTTLKLRHAFATFGAWGAGQTWSLLKDTDASPTTLDYFGPTGQFSNRSPQLRWTAMKTDTSRLAVALETAGSSLDQGNVTTVFPDLNVTTKTKFPDLTAQYRYDGSWGHWQVAGIVREIYFESRNNPGGNPSGSETGYGGNLAGAIKLGGNDKVQGQVAYGKGVASYFNDGFVDIGPGGNLQAEALPLWGWLLYYDHYWSPQWRSVVGYSEAVQDNSANQAGSAMHKGRYASANLLYTPAKKILVGGELLWGERRNNNDASGTDSRIQFSAKYEF